jgi:hypothetical protein
MKMYHYLTGIILFIFSFMLAASVDKVSLLEIERTRHAAVKAYNTQDIAALMFFWHKDGKMLGPETIDGHKKIRAHYEASLLI